MASIKGGYFSVHLVASVRNDSGAEVPLKKAPPGIRVFARDADEALLRVTESLSSLIELERTGRIVKSGR